MHLIAIASLAMALGLAVVVVDYRRRRLLHSAWRRLIRWEFWPIAAFYPPIAIYVLYLGLKHRCLTLFTVSNPGMAHGGIALDSKSAILRSLRGQAERVASFVLLEGSWSFDERLARLQAFMSENGLSFPIVLKPDAGERGIGVAILHDGEEAKAYLRGHQGEVIVQEYVPGLEFGVFYSRRPSEAKGQVGSLTAKLPTYVRGDGRRSLERLILDDPRAVCMARFFLGKFADRLDQVIPKGERFTLAELGTHSRGSLFLDAGYLWTPELERAFDELSRSFEGFCIGRYDVRVESEEAMRAGRGFKVLELNGVLSEPTHMYDPKHSLAYAWRTMFDLWREIFEIAAENRDRGHRPSTLRELFELIRDFRDQEKQEA